MCLRPSADNNATATLKQRWCIEEERVALLTFKQSFKDPHHRLSSWQGPDCCSWLGVSCHKFSRRVVKLNLRGSLFVSWDVYSLPLNPLETGELNPSLVKLKYLKYLDLSGNLFNGSYIPHFLGHMKELTYLNLSFTDFYGIVPHLLGNLSSLEVLDLSGIRGRSSPLYVDDFSWVSGLSSLQYLDMSGVHLQQAGNLAQVLSHLPSLLHLGYHNLFTTTPSINSTIQHLDLSWNFLTAPVLAFLQNMTSLKFLELQYNSLRSSVPLWFGNLKSLVHLNLAENNFNSIEGGLWLVLQNLCHLQSLDLSRNMFNGDSLSAVATNQLNMSVCARYDSETIYLLGSGFRGYLPEWLGGLENLKELRAASNSFHGSIPSAFEKLTSLRELDLSCNNLSGTIPSFFGGFPALRILDLSRNNLSGTIPSFLEGSEALETLDLSYNQLNGTIPTFWGELAVLRTLGLSHNLLNGIIPKKIGAFTALKRLDLSQNQLDGVIPKSLGQLVGLKELDISSNALEGSVSSEYHLANLSSLNYLSIGSNHLIKVKIDSNWVPPFQLYYIGMRSCKCESREFGNWLQTQKQVGVIDLFNASISGNLPLWLLQDMPRLHELDLSHNQIKGPIPSFTNGWLQKLLLVDNLLNGTIPNSFCDQWTLVYLDLSKNMLSGHIPNCWKSFASLFSINLSSNKLTGPIPSSFGNLELLGWLLLSNNSLKDVGDNELSGNIPKWIGDSITSLQILKLRNNMFNGAIPSQSCLLSQLQIMDLAQNNLVGQIPGCFGNLTGMTLQALIIAMAPSLAMSPVPEDFEDEWNKANVRQVMKGRELEYTSVLKFVVNLDLSSNRLVGSIPEQLTLLTRLVGLNLANNKLSGKIPKNTGDLKLLQSLDLSENKLSGPIPESLSDLTSLSYLNLSHNNLAGAIPKGNQLQTLVNPTLYEGNPQLCGAPLPKRCPGSGGGRDQRQQDNDDDDRLWFYLVVMLGCATGFWIVIGVLLIKKRWRRAYFQMVDETKDKIYVALAVKVGVQVLKKKIMKNGQ